MVSEKTDLRVARTKRAIRKTLCDMIVEMEYQEITVKELAQRAMINRNTFYLHYASIAVLAAELQDEIAAKFISMYKLCNNLEEIEEVIREYFEYVTSLSPLMEKIFFSDSYRFIARNINEQLAAHRRSVWRNVPKPNDFAVDFVLAYCGSLGTALFHQWVADGKRLPVEELVALAVKLICNGVESVLKS